MSLAPENADEREFQYKTDPTFGMVLDAMCRMAVEDESDKRMGIALDFFLYGVSIVDISRGETLQLDPAMCSETVDGVVVRPPNCEAFVSHPLVLKVEGEHQVPCIKSGMIQNMDPWLEEWEQANTKLDAWLEERLSR